MKTITNLTTNQNLSFDISVNYSSSNNHSSCGNLVLQNDRVGILFVKINNVSKKDIKKCIISLFFYNPSFNGDITFYRFLSSYSETTETSELAEDFDDDRVEPLFIKHFSSSSRDPNFIQIDITNEILRSTSGTNPFVWIAFHGNIPSTSSFSFYYYNNQIVSLLNHSAALICDDGQTINHNASIDYNCGSFDKSYLNLYTGNPIHIYECYKSNAQKNPLGFSVCYNKNKHTKNTQLGNDLYFNYQFDIYEECDGYIVEDYLGNRRYYEPIDTSDETYNPIRLGVLHSDDNYGDLYYCYEDASYLYKKIENSITVINLFDSSNNHYLFNVYSSHTQLCSIEDSNGFLTTLNWQSITGNLYYRIISVTNSSNNTIYFTYSNISLSIIEITNEGIEIDFTHPISGQLKIEVFRSNTSTRYFLFNYSSSGLLNVIDSLSSHQLLYSYSLDGKVSSITNKYNSTDICYQNNISYYDGYTIVDDNENHNNTYLFDNLGRVKTISDDNGNVQSFNYSEIAIDESIKSPNQVLSQNCRKYLINNHNFENTSSIASGWTKSGNALIYLSNDSISGNKSLCIDNSNGATATVQQTILDANIESGKTYCLKMWIKSNTTGNTGLTIKAVQSYKIGSINYQYNKPVTTTNISTEWQCITSSTFSFNSSWTNKSILIEINLSSSKTIYIDDVQLEEVHHNRTDLLTNTNYQLSNSSVGTLSTDSGTDVAKGITFVASQTFTPKSSVNAETYSIYKTISLSGNKGDSFLFNIFADCLKDTNQTFTGYVTFTLTDVTTKTYEFEFDNYLSSWQLLTKGVTAPDNYTSIEVGIKFSGYLSFKVNAIQLYKQTINEIREYDSCGKLAKSSSNNSDSFVIRNSKGLTSAILSSDGSYIKYSYNNNNTISEITDQYYQKTTYTYNQSGNTIDPISSIFTSGSITITKQNIYDGYQLSSKVDEYNDKISFAYDSLKRLSSIAYHSQTNPSASNKTTENYSYNNIDSKTKIYSSNLSPYIENNLGYLLDKETLSTVVNNGNLSYIFTYDSYHRLTSVKLGNEYINQFTYPSISNTHYHNKVLTKQYGGSGTTFTFTYDDYERPISVSIGNNVKYKYVYDEFGYIYSIEDIDNNIKTYYFYNSDGLLLKEINNGLLTTYKYNDKKELIQKINYDNSNEFTLYSYDSGDDINNREKFFMDFSRIYDVDLMYFPLSIHGFEGLSPYEYDQDTNAYDSNLKADIFNAHTGNHKLRIDLSTVKNNGANINPTKSLEWKLNYSFSKSFYLWFRLSGSLGTTSVNIMQIYNDDGLAFDIRVNALGQLEIASGNSIIYTSSALTFNSWNCLYLNVLRFIGALSTNVIISLNGMQSTITSSISDIAFTKVILAYNPSYGVNALPYDVSYFAFAVGYNVLDADTISALSSKSIAKITNTSTSNKYIHKAFFRGDLSSLDYIPLTNHLESIKGLKPNSFVFPEETLLLDNTSIFGSASSSDRKAYKSFKTLNTNSHLSYGLPLTYRGTINMFYEKSSGLSSNPRYIFSLYRSGSRLLSLSLSDNTYTLYYGGQSTTYTPLTPIFILESPQKFVSVTYNTSQAKLYINGSLVKILNLSNPMAASDTNVVLYVGENGIDKTTALDGYIENVSFSTSVLSATSISGLYNSSKFKTETNTIDKMGRIIQKDLPSTASGLLLGRFHTYSYNLTRLSSETTCKNETYNYSYDNAGNIIDISGAINRVYYYDKLNRLVEVFTDSGQLSLEYFEYDINNNITSHVFLDDNDNDVTHTFNYTNGKLTSVTDSNNNNIVSISYSTSSPLYPSSITLLGTNQSLSWLGNRLVNIGNNISYTYNDKGIRISKTVNNVTTTYRLEGNKIIQMNIGSTSLHFRYDLNNVLIGCFDGSEEYLYARDALGTIHGIINSNGNYVVKYTYNAFGLPNKEIQTGYEFDIVALNNPFMYKGYYYDSETGLYYCNSRYYYPLICRWISPDNISYLEPSSLIGINLYAYCKNNPVMYVDENGNSSILVALIVGLVLGVAWGAVSALASNDIENIGWYMLIGGFSGAATGVFGTFLSGFALFGFSFAIGFLGDTAIQHWLKKRRWEEINYYHSAFVGLANGILSIPGSWISSIIENAGIVAFSLENILANAMLSSPLLGLSVGINTAIDYYTKPFDFENMTDEEKKKYYPLLYAY